MIDLENLSPIDFEDLSLDLVKVLTGNRFEAFGPGRDRGIDGRFATSCGNTIMQAKHYLKSPFSSLLSTMRHEATKVKKLNPVRYILFTSHPLTPDKKDDLLDALRGVPIKANDILGREDIKGLLRNHPDIHKAHVKLWLSSTTVLEHLLNSGLEAFTKITREEILSELRVYVQNPSFNDAIEQLEEHNVLIISGPPGVGKTTLARILSYQYLKDGWCFYAIRSLNEGFKKVDDNKPTLFFFDDFLGVIELDRQALNQNSSELALFIKRIQNSKNARFILTSRAHIFEEASLVSDRVSESHVQMTKFILSLDQYTRRIRAHILLNHLAASDLTELHFSELLKDDWIERIVDHENYSPRVVSMVTSNRVNQVIPRDFPRDILDALDSPDRIWEKPYRALSSRCRHILLALFFSNERGETITNLRVNFGGLHEILCKKYNHSFGPNDFEDALETLESGFISISGDTVQFVNPAVRDFMKMDLNTPEPLLHLPAAAKRADWAQRLWKHGTNVLSQRDLRKFSESFIEFAGRIDHYPTFKRVNYHPAFKRGDHYPPIKITSRDDLPLGQRVEFLVSLAKESGKRQFLRAASSMIKAGRLDLVPDKDAHSLSIVHKVIRDSAGIDSAQGAQLLEQIEDLLATVIENRLAPEGLISVLNAVNKHFGYVVPSSITQAIESAVCNGEEYTPDVIQDLDTSQELRDHLEILERIEYLSGLDLSQARDAAAEKMTECEDREFYEYQMYDSENISVHPSSEKDAYQMHGSRNVSVHPRSENDIFDDRKLNSMFQTLIQNNSVPNQS